MAAFFQHPFELDNEPRVKNLYKKMWLTGAGIFDAIYKKLRKGNGTYPVDSIMLAAGTNKVRQRQIERVLYDFDLFNIEDGMVSLQEGLRVSDFLKKEQTTKSQMPEQATLTFESDEQQESL